MILNPSVGAAVIWIDDQAGPPPGLGGIFSTSPPPKRFYLHVGNIVSAIFRGAARFTATSTYFEPPGLHFSFGQFRTSGIAGAARFTATSTYFGPPLPSRGSLRSPQVSKSLPLKGKVARRSRDG